MADTTPVIKSEGAIPFWRDERVLNALTQIVSAVLVIGFLIWVVINFFEAAKARNLALNFNFLNNPAGFPISDPAIEYDSSMSFGRAFLVGLLNTLRVSVLGIVVATILGTLVALARLSTNWLLSRIALIYIEFHRNIPLLVLLFIWYFTVFAQLPPVDEAKVLPGPIYLTQRGIYMTWPRLTETGGIFMVFAVLGVLLAISAYIILRRRRAITGKETYYTPISLAILIVLPLIGWFASGGTPLYLDVPERVGFNLQGGSRLTPEYAGLFVGLVMYTAGFIAEVVRAGIQAVSRGQVEAARAVGLSYSQVLSLVVFPQALRVMIPPMISQYLNLTKNSSLALAIGYQDVFSVGRIAINQAGRAVPVFAMVMVTYLSMSLITSLILNIYNRRIQFIVR
jgi:general L-amino acid transport system permease protein